MLTKRTLHAVSFVIPLCLIVLWLSPPCVGQEEGTKGLKPVEAGIKTNPRRKTGRAVTLRTPNQFKRRPAPSGTKYAQLGVTIWLVDRGQSKGIEMEGEEQALERLDTNAPYTEGDTIRLTIESDLSGFMYIVDQECYADGSYGPAMLIYPTLKTRKGNNLIRVWETVEVPKYPAVWTFKPRELAKNEVRKEQTAEVLTFIISPTPLVARTRIGKKALALNKGEFEAWRLRWQRPTQQFDVEGRIGGVASTKGIEQSGEEAGGEDLVGSQTTYQTAIKPGNPVFVTIPLKFKSFASSASRN